MSIASCPCHPKGLHYFIFMHKIGTFCIDCGVFRGRRLKLARAAS